jgi:hypothetical protein
VLRVWDVCTNRLQHPPPPVPPGIRPPLLALSLTSGSPPSPPPAQVFAVRHQRNFYARMEQVAAQAEQNMAIRERGLLSGGAIQRKSPTGQAPRS